VSIAQKNPAPRGVQGLGSVVADWAVFYFCEASPLEAPLQEDQGEIGGEEESQYPALDRAEPLPDDLLLQP